MRFGVIAVVLLFLLATGCERAPTPTTAPATQASTKPATKPAPTTSYVDVIRAAYPAYPATQPLPLPVDYGDAGHFIIPEPVYLDPRGDLWITRADAPPLAEALGKSAASLDVHIVPERIYFASWATDEDGKWYPRVVVRNAAGNFEWIDGPERRATTAGRNYRWVDALFLGDGALAVPTESGVSIFSFTPQYGENDHDVLPQPAGGPAGSPSTSPSTTKESRPVPGPVVATTAPNAPAAVNPPVILLDPAGLLAFSPWDGNRPGGRGAIRFADGKWTQLNSDTNWPDRIVHLVPLLDGSVLQLYRKSDSGPVKLALVPLGQSSIDEAAIGKWVEQLSDDDEAKRTAAFGELTRYGPPSWPVLEKLIPQQPPEARVRIEQLLSNKAEPTLGGRKAVDGQMRIVDRFDDSGILLHLPAGVSIPQDDKPSLIVKPAWVSVRPGRAIELLEPVLIKDAIPARSHVYAFGDEWILSDSTDGPRRLLGNHLEPMVAKGEASWNHVVGGDRRGRWLFRQSREADSPTLIVDPTLPDVTPKLPVWIIYIPQGETGWSGDDYPAMKSGDAWALFEHGWQALDPKTGKFISELPNYASRRIMEEIWVVKKIRPKPREPKVTPPAPAPPGPPGAASQPATMPTTRVATTTTAPATAPTETVATTQEGERPILVDREGRKYFDGQKTLRIVDRDKKEIVWTLPSKAAGEGEVTLLRTADGTLFLFNEPGRIIRIKPTPDGAEPFVVEAIFTDRIPKPDHLQRIWLDPAGRIIIAYEKHKLAILFPEGIVPRDIADLIPAKQPDP